MTFSTDRLNVQPVFRRIAEMMMILLCHFVAIQRATAMKNRWFGKSKCGNRMVNGILSFNPFRVKHSLNLCGITFNLFPFLCLTVSFSVLFCIFRTEILSYFGLSFFAFQVSLAGYFVFNAMVVAIASEFSSPCCAIIFVILTCAVFTICVKSVFSNFIFMKIRHGFDLLASATSFGYNQIRHFCFPEQRCLEPLAGPIPVCGLFYNTTKRGMCQCL